MSPARDTASAAPDTTNASPPTTTNAPPEAAPATYPPPATSGGLTASPAVAEVHEIARELLAKEKVGVVIGWEDSRRGARPAFVTAPDDVERLIFDTRCAHNLATYLSPRRSQVAALGRAAVVVKGCDTRSVAGLLREGQVKRDEVVLIAVRCGGVLEVPDLPAAAPLTAETVSPRCFRCDCREPKLFDYLVGDPQDDPPRPPQTVDEKVRALDALPVGERWEYWTEQFSRCVRCYACRQVCPLCVCERCVADKSVPQWIETASHPRGNLAWNLTRALHLAGRCVECGACERACPAGLPLTLLNRKLAEVLRRRFGYVANDDPEVSAPVGDYRLDDGEEFIR